MTVFNNFINSSIAIDAQDPLLPYLRCFPFPWPLTNSFTRNWKSRKLLTVCEFRSIREALEDSVAGRDPKLDVIKLLQECIRNFKHSAQYRDDTRFLKIWLLYVIYEPFLFSISIYFLDACLAYIMPCQFVSNPWCLFSFHSSSSIFLLISFSSLRSREESDRFKEDCWEA